jgi:hypothetical protein
MEHERRIVNNASKIKIVGLFEAELCDSITLLFCQTFEIHKFKSIPHIAQISFYLTIDYYEKASNLEHHWPE